MDFGAPRKRGRYDAALNGTGGFKKSRPESDSFPTGVGSKSKPCTKFFSTSGCPFGEGCHFLHYIPGGYKTVSQMLNLSGEPLPRPGRSAAAPYPYPDNSAAPAGKSKMCKKFNFGTSATAKVSIDASLAGPVIGKNGSNSKQICRVTGVKLSIRDHETDSNKRNIELEGTFDQIKQASSMVEELIMKVKSTSGSGPPAKQATGSGAASNYRTKICENFTKGLCTFGDRCHFAHGSEELRKSAM